MSGAFCGCAIQAVCQEVGSLKESVTVSSKPIPAQLEWGEVLLSMKYAPIDAADTYTASLGGVYGGTSLTLPFVAGHQGVATVLKVPTAASRPAASIQSLAS